MFWKNVSLIVLAALSTTAMAADKKVYPANLCTPLHSSGMGQIEFSYSRIINNSTLSPVTVYCPIVRDEDSSGSTITAASISVYDRNNGDNITCNLRAASASGSTTDYSTKTSSGYGSSPQTLSFSSVSMSGSTGPLYIRCQIPERDISTSRLNSYSITED